MTPTLAAAPSAETLAEASRQFDAAQTAVGHYVNAAFKGYPSTVAIVWRSSITLTGYGKVWRDGRGHRVLKRVTCRYGDWPALDRLIIEAKAHYDSRRKA